MYRFNSHKGQGTIEFAVLFGVVIFLFIILFIFLVQQLGVSQEFTERQEEELLIQDIFSEIQFAWGATPGYSKEILFDDDLLATDAEITFVKVPGTNIVREILTTTANGDDLVYFVPPNILFVADACDGQNQIIRTPEGVGMCCGTCNGTLPGLQLGGDILSCSSERQGLGFYEDCANFDYGNEIRSIRVNCLGIPSTVTMNLENTQGLLPPVNLTYDLDNNGQEFVKASLLEKTPYYYYDFAIGVDITGGLYEIRATCEAANPLLTRTFTDSWDIGIVNEVTACGTLDQPNTRYIVVNDLSSTGTCLTIGADNIEVIGAGQGKTIAYGSAGSGYGLTSDGFNNITVKNIDFDFDSAAVSVSNTGFFMQNGNNVMLENVTFAGPVSNGIYFNTIRNLTVEDVAVNTVGTTGFEIETSYNVIFDDVVIDNDGDIGLEQILVSDFYATDLIIGSSVGDYGIKSSDGSGIYLNDTQISNNGDYGLLIEAGGLAQINDLFVSNSQNYGVSLDSFSPATFNNSFIENAGSYGINLVDAYDASFEQTYIANGNERAISSINSQDISFDGLGIYNDNDPLLQTAIFIGSGSRRNTFSDTTINVAQDAISLDASTDTINQIRFEDLTLLDNNTIYATSDGHAISSNMIINSTPYDLKLNNNDDSLIEFYKGWWATVYAFDALGDPVSNVDITAVNNIPVAVGSGSTGIDGYARKIQLIESLTSVLATTPSYQNLTPNILAVRPTNPIYLDKDVAVSAQANSFDAVNVQADAVSVSTCQTLTTGVYRLTQNLFNVGTCFTIQSDNVVFDGDGYTVEIEDGYAFTIINSSDVTIHDVWYEVDPDTDVAFDGGILAENSSRLTVSSFAGIGLEHLVDWKNVTNSTIKNTEVWGQARLFNLFNVSNILIVNASGNADQFVFYIEFSKELVVENTTMVASSYPLILAYVVNYTQINSTILSTPLGQAIINEAENVTVVDGHIPTDGASDVIFFGGNNKNIEFKDIEHGGLEFWQAGVAFKNLTLTNMSTTDLFRPDPLSAGSYGFRQWYFSPRIVNAFDYGVANAHIELYFNGALIYEDFSDGQGSIDRKTLLTQYVDEFGSFDATIYQLNITATGYQDYSQIISPITDNVDQDIVLAFS